MSRNYDILRQTEKALDLYQTPGKPLAATPATKHRGNGMSPQNHDEVVKLVQSVFLGAATAVPRVVVFTAVERHNGCSWVCARVAEALASQVETSGVPGGR